MELSIIGPKSHAVVQIAWLELDTTQGNFVIQPGHIPTVLQLKPSSVLTFCLTSGKQETVPVSGGIAHVSRARTVILLAL